MSSMDFAERDGVLVGAWETGGQVYWTREGDKHGLFDILHNPKADAQLTVIKELRHDWRSDARDWFIKFVRRWGLSVMTFSGQVALHSPHCTQASSAKRSTGRS